MKTNEAPEKIYLVRTTRIIDEWRKKPSQYAHNIEYTRTDAFIEKACKWLEDNLLDYWEQINEAPDNFIEDFRNHLKE